MLSWSILQYFWSAFNDDLSWKPIFGLYESGRFRQVLLYSTAKQRRLRWACADAQTHQSLSCSHTQSIDVDEDLDQDKDFTIFGYVRIGV